MRIIRGILSISQGAVLAFTVATSAQANNCVVMAQMANDVASIRDMGASLSFVETRLRRDVKDPAELAMAVLVAKIVYRTRASGADLQREVMKKC